MRIVTWLTLKEYRDGHSESSSMYCVTSKNAIEIHLHHGHLHLACEIKREIYEQQKCDHQKDFELNYLSLCEQ